MTSSPPTAESPCIGACRLNPEGRACLSCGRTLREIAHWRDMSEDERRRVNARLQRAQRALAADRRS